MCEVISYVAGASSDGALSGASAGAIAPSDSLPTLSGLPPAGGAEPTGCLIGAWELLVGVVVVGGGVVVVVGGVVVVVVVVVVVGWLPVLSPPDCGWGA